jgi:hypothetical protein
MANSQQVGVMLAMFVEDGSRLDGNPDGDGDYKRALHAGEDSRFRGARAA